MMGDGQNVQSVWGDSQQDGGQAGQVRGVHAQGGKGEGGKKGQGGKVKLAMDRMEGGSTELKLPRFVKRDRLVQKRIRHLVQMREVASL